MIYLYIFLAFCAGVAVTTCFLWEYINSEPVVKYERIPASLCVTYRYKESREEDWMGDKILIDEQNAEAIFDGINNKIAGLIKDRDLYRGRFSDYSSVCDFQRKIINRYKQADV